MNTVRHQESFLTLCSVNLVRHRGVIEKVS